MEVETYVRGLQGMYLYGFELAKVLVALKREPHNEQRSILVKGMTKCRAPNAVVAMVLEMDSATQQQYAEL